MFDRLPPELVAWIIEYCGAAFDSDEYHSRRSRNDLYCCCLVSRNFRDHAQPVLWREVIVLGMGWSRTPEKTSANSPAFDALRWRTRVLRTIGASPVALTGLSALYPNLDNVWVALTSEDAERDLRDLGSVPKLTEAVLYFRQTVSARFSFRFPHLVHLGLYVPSSDNAAVMVLACLMADTVPSLRTLVLEDLRIGYDLKLHHTLRAQLDLLQVSSCTFNNFFAADQTGWTAEFLVSALEQYDYPPYTTLAVNASPTIRQLQLRRIHSDFLWDRNLNLLLDALRGYEALETLYLPFEYSLWRLDGLERGRAERLRDLLSERKIEMRCVAPADYGGLNRDCWARARARKREQMKQ